jgi:hypothetical protein
VANQKTTWLRDPWTIAGGAALLSLLFFGLHLPLLVAGLASAALWHGIGRQQASLREEAPRDLFSIATWAAIALPACLYFLFLTHGSGVLLADDLLSGAFDSLAQGLLAGSSEVDPKAIGWEAFEVDGRSHMYFGLFPALLRIPLQPLAAEHAGHWARLSCFIAAVIALTSFAHLCASMLIRNRGLAEDDRRFFLTTAMLGFGFASPLVFLNYTASIYHESMLWGFAGSLAFTALLLPRIDSPEALRSALAPLATIAGATLLARVTFGGPLYLILLFVAVWLLREASRVSRRELVEEAQRSFVHLLPAAVLLLVQLWYNHDRFGSIFIFVQYDLMDFMRNDAEAMAILADKGKFNLERLAPAMSNYFGLKPEFIAQQFPWFRIAPPSYPDAGLYPRLFDSYLISLTLSASWLVLGAGGGLAMLVRGRRSPLTALCALAFFSQFLLISAYYILEERYAVDLLPFLIFCFAILLSEIASRGWLVGRAKDVVTVLIFTVAVSSIVTTMSTLSAIPVSGPGLPNAYKVEWGERFNAINARVSALRGN